MQRSRVTIRSNCAGKQRFAIHAVQGTKDGVLRTSGGPQPDATAKFAVTAGTIFDRSSVPLRDWLPAAWHMTDQKHGSSSLGLEQLLGLRSQQTTSTMLHTLRTARASRKRSSARVSSKWMKLMSVALNRGFAEARQARNSSLGLPSKSCRPRGSAAYGYTGCTMFLQQPDPLYLQCARA
jgi:hypothetical protein